MLRELLWTLPILGHYLLAASQLYWVAGMAGGPQCDAWWPHCDCRRACLWHCCTKSERLPLGWLRSFCFAGTPLWADVGGWLMLGFQSTMTFPAPAKSIKMQAQPLVNEHSAWIWSNFAAWYWIESVPGWRNLVASEGKSLSHPFVWFWPSHQRFCFKSC